TLVGIADKADARLDGMRYNKKQGEYVLADANNWAEPCYVLFSSSDKYDPNDTIGNVLGTVLGDLGAMFEVMKNFKGEILFEIKLNLAFEITLKSSNTRFFIRDLDLAIDAWMRHTNNGETTKLAGIYYNYDKDTGRAGLYLDLEWLLGAGAKIYVDLSQYPIENLLSTLLGGAIAGMGAGDAQTVATAVELPKPEGGDPNLAGAYVNIFSNAFAIEVTAGFIKLIVGLLVKTDSQAITDMLPNFKVYAKANLHPYALVIGAVLFNKQGTKAMLDFNIKLNGFNGDENSSKIDFGSEETFLAREAEQIKKNDPNYIFYYANFENGKGDYKKVDDKKHFQEVASGTGDYIKSDSQFVEITADRQQPFGKATANQKPYDGIVYIPDPNTPGSYIPLDDGKGTYKGNFRKLAGIDTIVNNQYVETATWHNYGSGLFIVNPITQEYEYVSRLSLLGFQGMQYKRIETKNPEGEVTAVTYEPLAWKNKQGVVTTEPDLEANLAAATAGTTKTYKKVNDFANYSKVANINLNSLISDISSGKPLDVASLLGDIKTAELGLNLNLSVTLKDVI
ncbi:MAG: hypothetical protein RSB59_06220, partial [Clostridia bacterium]